MYFMESVLPIIGTSPKSIDIAEEKKFGRILKKLNIECPKYGTGRTLLERQK